MKGSSARGFPLLAAVFSFAITSVIAQTPPRVTPMTPDVVEKYDQTLASADYVRREVMVPMRDGVKLFTVVVMKKALPKHQSCCRARPITRAVRRAASIASASST